MLCVIFNLKVIIHLTVYHLCTFLCGLVWFDLTDYMCHVYVRSDDLATILISDLEYPQRVAFTVLNKVCFNKLN